MRVSTDKQDLSRQKDIELSTRDAGYYIAGVYREKASGARVDRPELQRMIADLQPGEVVVTEKIDRISRLPLPQAEQLVNSIRARGARPAIPGLVDLSDLATDAPAHAERSGSDCGHFGQRLPSVARSRRARRRAATKLFEKMSRDTLQHAVDGNFNFITASTVPLGLKPRLGKALAKAAKLRPQLCSQQSHFEVERVGGKGDRAKPAVECTYSQLLIQELATRPGSILNRRRQASYTTSVGLFA